MPDLELLENTADPVERNALALRCAEARLAGADKVLARLIQRPDLVDARGTLVHALGYFDCTPYIALLVDLVITGSFEVAHEALEALETLEEVEGDDVDYVSGRVDQLRAAGGPEDWREPLVEDLLDMFA